MEVIYHAEGRATPYGGSYRYEYTLRDHLGNSRVNFADLDGDNEVDETEILQQNHYYPFGMNIENPAWSGTNGYQYNGKELNTDFGLDWNDYGARWYDAGLGRWTTVDPLADEYASISPYAYVANMPTRAIDPDGRRIFFVGGANNDQEGWNYINRWGAAFGRSGIQGFTRINASRGKAADVAFTGRYRNSGHEVYSTGRVNPNTVVAGLSPSTEFATRPVQNEVVDDAVGQVQANLAANPLADGEQLNLGGYSYGSVLQAQTALKLANDGTFVDNLILIGSPVSSDSDLYKQLSENENIGNIIRVDIEGDLLSDPQGIMDYIRGGVQNVGDGGPHFDLARPGTDKAIQVVTDWLKKQGVE